jgi:hypothetical protein
LSRCGAYHGRTRVHHRLDATLKDVAIERQASKSMGTRLSEDAMRGFIRITKLF